MHTVCKTCGNIIQDPKCERCPRCYAILKQVPKCEDCKGCTLKLNHCNKVKLNADGDLMPSDKNNL